MRLLSSESLVTHTPRPKFLGPIEGQFTINLFRNYRKRKSNTSMKDEKCNSQHFSFVSMKYVQKY